MYYVYVLRSLRVKDEFYVGYTSDLRQRLSEHNQGQSFHTKKFMPWELLYYEAYMTEALAIQRERRLKHHGKGLDELKKRAIEG